MIIGLTGASGSGKSSASKIFANLGLTVIDADKIYHDLLQNCSEMKTEINDNFDGVLYNNQIDRKKLGEIVFEDTDKLLNLNKITHKFVTAEVKSQIINAKTTVILDVPLLFEANYHDFCDKTIGIVANDDLKIARICKRDDISILDAKKRLKNQKNNMFFYENCDIIIENNLSFACLTQHCKQVLIEIGA